MAAEAAQASKLLALQRHLHEVVRGMLMPQQRPGQVVDGALAQGYTC